MIKGYINTYKQLELLNKAKIDEQIQLYAIGSKMYDKNKLRQAMLNYKAAINLPLLMSHYSAKWAKESQQLQTAVK